MAMQLGNCSAGVRIADYGCELAAPSASCSGSACCKPARVLDVSRSRFRTTMRGRGSVLVRASNGGNKPGDSESKQVYDAFFLGKALAETINERLGTAIGEFLSDVGRRQAEQQKKVREFQDEVQERASSAAAKAAQKAMAIERANKGTDSSTSPPSQPPPSTSSLSDSTDVQNDVMSGTPSISDGVITIED